MRLVVYFQDSANGRQQEVRKELAETVEPQWELCPVWNPKGCDCRLDRQFSRSAEIEPGEVPSHDIRQALPTSGGQELNEMTARLHEDEMREVAVA
jgi:hypothetical protein